jgi:hypothetical protein
MPTRREFIKDVASGAAGFVLVPQADAPVRRREVAVGGRRIKVIDVHGHCLIPEVLDVIKDPALAGAFKNTLAGGTLPWDPNACVLDAQGIDVQALSINAFCTGPIVTRSADREIQNEKLGMVRRPARSVRRVRVGVAASGSGGRAAG